MSEQIYHIISNGDERLIRAKTLTAVRKHLLAPTVIDFADQETIVRLMMVGKKVENAASGADTD